MTAQAEALRPPRLSGKPARLTRSAAHLHPVRDTRPAVPNVVIGMLVFLGTEAMFFAGLISALLVLRAGSPVWPPLDQPRLPVGVTAVNTLILLFSGYSMRRALTAIRGDRAQKLIRRLTVTALLGGIFLAVQGSEWIRLVHFGLGVSSGVYGATFYTLIGAHGLHVLGGVIVLLAVLRGARRGGYSAREHAAVEASQLYWLFVVAIWPILYILVYLA